MIKYMFHIFAFFVLLPAVKTGKFGDWLKMKINLLKVLLTYLLTPYSRVLLEKLTDSQLVKKFPAFYGTRWFITAFTNAHHLYLS
jgi:hypothetical protein